MISASLPSEGLAQLGQLSQLSQLGQLGHLYPASMTPEFLPPPPRPYARYPQRPAPTRPLPRAEAAPAPPAFSPVPGAYTRFLPHPAPYAPYLYRAPAPAPGPPPHHAPTPPFSSRGRAGSGFVPPAPRSPPAPDPPAPPPSRSPDRTAAPPAPHFCRGALIRLENGVLRRVEDMRTEDFVSSADRCTDVSLTHCTLLRLEERGNNISVTLAYDKNRSQVEMECVAEHPWFVVGAGWASCSPERTLRLYGLRVRPLQVGDVCVSLMERERPAPPAALPPPALPPPPPPPPPPQTFPENLSIKEEARKRRWSAPDVTDDDLHPPLKKR